MFSVNRHRKKSNSRGRIQNNLVRVYIDKIYEPCSQKTNCRQEIVLKIILSEYISNRYMSLAARIKPVILKTMSRMASCSFYISIYPILLPLSNAYSNLSTKFTIYSYFSLSFSIQEYYYFYLLPISQFYCQPKLIMSQK